MEGAPHAESAPCLPAWHLSPAAWSMPGLKKCRHGMLSSHSEANPLGPTGSGIYTKSSPKSVMISDLTITQGFIMAHQLMVHKLLPTFSQLLLTL